MEGRGKIIGFKIYGILVYIYLLLPMVVIVVFSFNSNRLPTLPLGSFSLKWYIEAFTNPVLLGSVSNSFLVAITASIVSTMIGIPGGYVLVRYGFSGKKILDKIKFLPLIIPPLLLGFGLMLFFAAIPFVRFSLLTLIISHILFTLPYVLLLTSARLIGFDWALEEASKDLGARNLRTFFFIVVPYLMPAITASIILSFILSFNEIIIAAWVIGNFNTLPIYMWSQFQRYISPEINAISTAIIIIVALFLSLIFLVLRNLGRRRS
jgi:spermidine/putrescine transport system permease protein